MKKTIAILLAAIMMLGLLAGCSSVSESLTLEEGKLIMSTNAAFPPYEMTDDAGNCIGIDVEVAQAIAEKLGLELVIDNMEFTAALEAAQAAADAIVANYSRTTEKDGKLIMNAVSIGDSFAFVTFPGELFDSLSVRMEDGSPFKTTMLLGYCYHHLNYLPSMAAFKYGSYEVDVTRFQCGMGETVADTYHQMLKELK